MKKFPSHINELFSLEGKVAVIIGGGGHICSSLAEGYALAGASVSIVDLRVEKALRISKNINSKYGNKTIYIQADAGKEDSLQNALFLTLREFSKILIIFLLTSFLWKMCLKLGINLGSILFSQS